ncbi:SCO2522 family protein [Nocardia wallacei]|uniref:SCO2522 family protein n=1 Tax=Nocardia wallacei TaxID=480035 RepID=UPI002455560A|nr:SCO2522 family protein [Nocardia wallacei]
MPESPVYSEATAEIRVAEVPLSHLSIETGHFYMNELINGQQNIRAQFREVVDQVEFYTASARKRFGSAARVSTCFLIDDYFAPDTNPTEILNKLLNAADDCGLRIDYLAREAGCWEYPVYVDGVPTGPMVKLAETMAARVVAEPSDNTTGRRPPDVESGWLCNGRRSSDHDPAQAMRAQDYRPPLAYGRRVHSIFLDTEMWDSPMEGVDDKHTRWSCPFLASIWQLLRLGMVRFEGAAPFHPQLRSRKEGWEDHWWEMPAVIQLNPDAKPFAAYRSLSILPQDYLGIEHAVHVILDHLELDEQVWELISARGGRERVPVEVPRETSKRLSHVLLDGCLA